MMLMALDPNICLAASYGHFDSESLLDYIYDKRDYISLVIDDIDTGEEILTEYENLLIRSDIHRNVKNLLAWYIENRDRQIKALPAPKAKNTPLFAPLGCDTPVEPHLISLGIEPGRNIWLIVVGDHFYHESLKPRGIHQRDVLSYVKEQFHAPHLRVYDSSLPTKRALDNELIRRPFYPNTELELQEYLSRAGSSEGQTLEFKQPFNRQPQSGQYVTQSILREVMEAICALANSQGGDVLLGIAEPEQGTGKIEGVVPQFKGRNGFSTIRSYDALSLILENDPAFLRAMRPRFTAKELEYNIVQLANSRIVIGFRVQAASKTKSYHRKVYDRYGTVTSERS